MKVEYSDVARRQFKRLPKGKQLKVLSQIEKLKVNPYAGKKLRGEFKEFYAIRAWPYRVVYRYFPRRRLLFINVIRHRQKVYK